jgi:hypothetical protein
MFVLPAQAANLIFVFLRRRQTPFAHEKSLFFPKKQAAYFYEKAQQSFNK